MKIVNNLMKAPQLAVTMQEFSKEMTMVNNNLSCRNAVNSYCSLCSGIRNCIYYDLLRVVHGLFCYTMCYAYKHVDTHLYTNAVMHATNSHHRLKVHLTLQCFGNFI